MNFVIQILFLFLTQNCQNHSDINGEVGFSAIVQKCLWTWVCHRGLQEGVRQTLTILRSKRHQGYLWHFSRERKSLFQGSRFRSYHWIRASVVLTLFLKFVAHWQSLSNVCRQYNVLVSAVLASLDAYFGLWGDLKTSDDPRNTRIWKRFQEFHCFCKNNLYR